jgi:hypothetical protein
MANLAPSQTDDHSPDRRRLNTFLTLNPYVNFNTDKGPIAQSKKQRSTVTSQICILWRRRVRAEHLCFDL